MTCVKFSGAFDGIIEKLLELLHYGKYATECFFLDSLQVKGILSYHGNRKEYLEGSK